MTGISRFNGVQWWRKLTRKEQELIGTIALELVVSSKTIHATEGIVPEPMESVANRAAHAAANVLLDKLDEVVSQAVVSKLDFSELLPIPSLVGEICKRCGCSSQDPCEGGCYWVEPGLCSACASAPISRSKAGQDH
jgi:hypothetical protein